MKKNLCIFIGYTSFLREFYGTELSIVRLASQLSKVYNIFVVTLSEDETVLYDDFVYVNYKNINIPIEILIISRYVNYFTYCHFKPCKKIYLWVHDVGVLAYYQSYVFDNNGMPYIHNFLDKIDKIIVLSDWHKSFFQTYYEIPDNKIEIIGNGITTSLFGITDVSKKIQNRFIWTSCLNRGIERTIEILKIVQKVYPELELHVFRDTEGKDELVKNYEIDAPFVKFHGRVDNLQIIEEFKQSDIWFYPTTFSETYCISALEAQMSKCVTIATNVASLSTTVGNRGILIPYDFDNEKIAEIVIDILQNEELKSKLRGKGYDFAVKQDWKDVSKKWLKLFRKKKYIFF